MPPVTTATCSVCNHPAILKIDRYLGQPGMAYARAARRWPPLSEDALQRHHKNHVTPTNIGGLTAPQGPNVSARDKLLALIGQLEQQAKMGMRTDLARELRLAYADLDKLADHSAPETVTSAQVEGMDEFLKELAQALRPFPEASRVVGALVAKRFPS